MKTSRGCAQVKTTFYFKYVTTDVNQASPVFCMAETCLPAADWSRYCRCAVACTDYVAHSLTWQDTNLLRLCALSPIGLEPCN